MLKKGERQHGKSLPNIDPLHIWRYAWAATRVHGTRVLDFACGIGYGSQLIAMCNKKSNILAADIEEEALDLARIYYPHPRVSYLPANLLNFSWPNNLFDTIISLESLEHVERPEIVLDNFRKHLEISGTLIVSLPIIPTINLNKFHKFEVNSMSEAEEFFRDNRWHVEETTIQDMRFGMFKLRIR